MKNRHQLLQRMINEGILRKQSEITIPPGTYHCAKAICVTDLCQTTFNGTGVKIIMTNTRESGFVFNNCRAITLKGFAIDYDPLPFTQATVVSQNEEATEFEFEIHEGYPDFTVTGNYGFGFRAEVFDPETLRGKMDDIYPIEKKALSSRRGCIKLATARPSLEPGDYLAFVNRERDFLASAIEFKHCSTVRLEDLTILASPGMAVYCADMDGENYFRYTVTRGPQDKYGVTRLISTNADGLHYHGGRRGPIIERCDFSFMSDDSVNINGPSFVVAKIENPTDLWIEAYKYNAICFCSLAKGDLIRFMSPENYEIVAMAHIESFGEIHDLAEVADAKLRKMMMADYAGDLLRRGGAIRVSCDRPLKLSGNEYCNVFSLNCPDFKIRDSYFHDHRAIGLRIFGTDGVIENNRFERIKFAAINVGPAYFGSHDGWSENITIRGNEIFDCSFFSGEFPGVIAVSTAKLSDHSEYKYPPGTRNITIEKNTIENCGASGIFVNAADGVCIHKNQLCQTNQRDCRHALHDTINAEYAIDVQNSLHLDISDNTVKKLGQYGAGIERKKEQL